MQQLKFYKPDLSRNVWITSDTHAFHVNICRGTTQWTDSADRCRDFDTPEEMTRHIADKINFLVHENDILFHLGDWSFAGHKNIPIFREMINCKHVVLLLGNHDHNIERNEKYHSLFEYIGRVNEFRVGGQLVRMSHYPETAWNEIGRNALMLHGHCHGTLKEKLPNRFDMGVDCHNYYPIHLDEVLKWTTDFEAVDHHTERTNYH